MGSVQFSPDFTRHDTVVASAVQSVILSDTHDLRQELEWKTVTASCERHPQKGCLPDM